MKHGNQSNFELVSNGAELESYQTVRRRIAGARERGIARRNEQPTQTQAAFVSANDQLIAEFGY